MKTIGDILSSYIVGKRESNCHHQIIALNARDVQEEGVSAEGVYGSQDNDELHGENHSNFIVFSSCSMAILSLISLCFILSPLCASSSI